MTKKDFIAVAAVIKKEREVAKNNPAALLALTATALGLSAEFSKINPRFDRNTFLAACGLPR